MSAGTESRQIVIGIEDAEFLKLLGCSSGAKNVFGVSAGMVAAG